MTIEQYEQQEYLNLICDGMLTERMKQLLREKYVYGYTASEMAQSWDMTEGMIHHRLSKIRKKIKWAYDNYVA